jgi:hypothetical protein
LRFRLHKVEDDDLVVTGLQPGRRTIQALLRADAPEAAEVMTVHPHHAFAVARHVDEGVGGLIQAKRATEEDARFAG